MNGSPASLCRYRRFLQSAACPACMAALAEAVSFQGLTCTRCGATYHVQDGIPILLTDESNRRLASGRSPAGGSLMPGWIPRRLANWIRMNCLAGPGTDRHQQSRLGAFVAGEPADALIVDLGAGGRRLAPHVLSVDIGSSPEVDVVADGHALPFGNGTVARMVCTGVLEHVNFPERVVAEMYRVLRPGGRVYAAVPFLQGFHPGTGTSQDFQRYTHVGLAQLLAKFCIVESGISGGPSAALAWILREYLALPFAWSRVLYKCAYLVSGPLTSWLRWLDVLLDSSPQARRIACGFYVIGEKVGRIG
jgi:uncharacterized protein YbaR (Trm112 family)/SAM-dependent methyltransferase